MRLGWWIGNPYNPAAWQEGHPRYGFAWFFRELLGLTNEEQPFVYLSDGGHFENLGIYELIRRRCKVIVASDVSQDPSYGGADLRNAIERCRVDFGVGIYIDSNDESQARTEWHRVVAFNRLGESIADTLHKGDHVLVDGQLVSSKYDRENGKSKKAKAAKFAIFWSVRANSVRRLSRAEAEAPVAAASPEAGTESGEVPF